MIQAKNVSIQKSIRQEEAITKVHIIDLPLYFSIPNLVVDGTKNVYTYLARTKKQNNGQTSEFPIDVLEIQLNFWNASLFLD